MNQPPLNDSVCLHTKLILQGREVFKRLKLWLLQSEKILIIEHAFLL